MKVSLTPKGHAAVDHIVNRSLEIDCPLPDCSAKRGEVCPGVDARVHMERVRASRPENRLDLDRVGRAHLALHRQGLDYAPIEMTCWKCQDEPTCRSAWDMYNTNGDCLEEK